MRVLFLGDYFLFYPSLCYRFPLRCWWCVSSSIPGHVPALPLSPQPPLLWLDQIPVLPLRRLHMEHWAGGRPCLVPKQIFLCSLVDTWVSQSPEGWPTCFLWPKLGSSDHSLESCLPWGSQPGLQSLQKFRRTHCINSFLDSLLT